MKNYDYILFDLDGTLTDPAEGLVCGFEYAFKKLKVDYGERSTLRRFIGPPLYEEWQRVFGFTPEESAAAIAIFREYYDIYGWWDNRPYDGIHKMLAELRARGKKLAVATSKPEDTAKRVLNLFDLTQYFDFIGGALRSTARDKKIDVINYVLDNLGVSDRRGVVIVGDRRFDAEGAALAGIDAVGVLWGHGSRDEILASGFSGVVEHPAELCEMLK